MFALLAQKRFAPLFWTQFLSAFNDNFLKNALDFPDHVQDGGPQCGIADTVAGAVFILPFFILSGLGGQLADRYDKAMIAQRLKLVECGAALVAVAGFALQSVPLLFVALALFGTLSTLFGPIKYGILPDHLQKSELPAGNALIEGATFIAILLGTIVGGLASRDGGDPAKISAAMLLVAVACYVASRFIPSTGGEAPDLRIDSNILRSTRDLLRELWSDKRLWRTGIMVSLFWMFGAIALVRAAADDQDAHGRRGNGRQHLSQHFRHFGGARLRARLLLLQRPHRAAARARRHAGAGVLFGRTRFGASFHACAGDGAAPRRRILPQPDRLARWRRSRGHGGRGRRAGGAELRRRPVLGAGRKARAHRRRDQCAQRRLHGRAARWPSLCCRPSASASTACSL